MDPAVSPGRVLPRHPQHQVADLLAGRRASRPTRVGPGVLAACDIDKAVEAGYTARRDAGKAARDRGTWRVYEDTMAMSPPKGCACRQSHPRF
jgi:hypothetical protein